MTLLMRGKKVEITKQLKSESAVTFSHWIGCFGVVWNCKVAEKKELMSEFHEKKKVNPGISFPETDNKVAHFQNEDRPWLSEIPSQIRRNAGDQYKDADTAFVRGLREKPKFKSRFGKRSCLISKELYDCKIEKDILLVSFKKTAKSPSFCMISLPIPEGMKSTPNQFWISRKGARFFISWSYEREFNVESIEVLRNRLAQTPIDEQEKLVLGADAGIAIALMKSDGVAIDFSPQEKAKLAQLDKQQRRFQRSLSRRKKGSKNRNKARLEVAKKAAYKQNIRINFAHHASKAIAEQAKSAVVMEDLKIVNMTRRPKAKPVLNASGEIIRWEKNRAAQKAGLNRAILNVGWGRIRTFTEYKCKERNKLFEKVQPHYTSQECNQCGYTSPENRKTQENFQCKECGHKANADHNAAKNLVKKYLKALNTGTLDEKFKPKTKIAIRRKPKDRTAGTAESNVCGGDLRPGESKATPKKQKSPSRETRE